MTVSTLAPSPDVSRAQAKYFGTAFVFAGGGSHGAVQVGMLRALHAFGIRADFVVGTSVGAVNGVHYAGDPTAEGIERLARVWTDLSSREVYPGLPLGWLRAIVGQHPHVVDPRSLRRLLERNFRTPRLEDAVLPAVVIAADARDGSEVLLSRGSAVDAVLASAAIPVLFPPVLIDDRLLVDGAIAKNAAISTAVALGAECVVVLPTGFGCAVTESPRNVIAMGMHVVTILLARQLVNEAARHAGHLPIVVVPPVCPMNVSSYDFSHAQRLIASAEESTTRWLVSGGLDDRTIPLTLAPHTH